MAIFCGLPEELFLCCGGQHEEEQVEVEKVEVPKKKRLFRRKSSISNTSSKSSASVPAPVLVEKEEKGGKKGRSGRRKPLRLFRRVDSNNTTSTVNSNDEELEVEEVLSTLFPTMTEMEIKRFSRNRSLEKARKKSTAYMKWRKLYDLDNPSFRKNAKLSSDWDIWNAAAVHAARKFDGYVKIKSGLPRIVRFGEVNDLLAADGRRMVQVYPGMIDGDVAPLEFYALCFAIYIDLKLDRKSDETVHVLIDTRHGKGWTNAPAMSLIPFVKSLVKNLEENMPERMFSCILYPLRPACKPIWTVFKGFLHQKVVDKIRIYWGPATPDSPIPKEMVNKAFTKNVVESIEQCRTYELELSSQHIS